MSTSGPGPSQSGSGPGAWDIFHLLGSRHPHVEIPGSVFSYVREQESNGHRIRRDGTAEPLNKYLQRIGVHDDIISRVLDEDSRLVAELSYSSLFDSPLDVLRTRLEEHFGAVFVLQQAVLDSEVLSGFNRHGLDHLKSVSDRVLRLIRASDLEPAREALAEKEAIIAGYLHDSGNLISRQYHGAYGVYLIIQFFSQVNRDEETLSSFLRVLEAVLFHEVEIGLRLSSLVGLEPATLGLIIADKTDVSARRVSAKSNVPEAIRDAHTLVNLLTVDSRIGCREKEFSWELHFSPRAEAEEVARFPLLLKPSERVWVPQVWQQLYREHNVEYLFVFQATFLKLYLARLLFVIRSVFELYPQVQVFRLVVDDVERGISLSRVFGRDDYEAKITVIGKNLFKENWEETYLYQSLA
jgi:hypothetical protein